MDITQCPYSTLEPKMKKRKRLNKKLIPKIKKRLWDGETQEAIAEEFNTNQSTISRIMRGESYGKIPWPDGTTGVLSRGRRNSAEIQARQKLEPWSAQDIVQRSQERFEKEVERKDQELRRSVQRVGENKQKASVPMLRERIPLHDLKVRFPDFPLLTAIERINNPKLIEVVENVYAFLSRQVWGPAYYTNEKAIKEAIITAAKQMNVDLPDLSELFGEEDGEQTNS